MFFVSVAEHAKRSLVMQVIEFLESKPFSPKQTASCITSLLSIFCIDVDSNDDALAHVPNDKISLPVSAARKGRKATKSDAAFVINGMIQQRPVPRMRRLSKQSESSLPFVEFEASTSNSLIESKAMSSCSDSGSEMELFCNRDLIQQSELDSFIHATRSMVASKVASKPRAAAAAGSSRTVSDSGVFLDSCNRIHIQCKLVRFLVHFFAFFVETQTFISLQLDLTLQLTRVAFLE